MRLQIDTEKKIIKIDEKIQMRKLIEFVEKMLPEGLDYILEPTVINNWSSPIIINKYKPWWEKPWWEHIYDTTRPVISYLENTGKSTASDGVYFNDTNDAYAVVKTFGGTYNVQL